MRAAIALITLRARRGPLDPRASATRGRRTEVFFLEGASGAAGTARSAVVGYSRSPHRRLLPGRGFDRGVEGHFGKFELRGSKGGSSDPFGGYSLQPDLGTGGNFDRAGRKQAVQAGL